LKSQNQKLLAYLQKSKSITQFQALNLLGIMRLASRIYDLRSAGHEITTSEIAVKNRHGKKVIVAQYQLNRGE